MNNFEDYLKEVNEVGFIEEVHHSLVYISGLPSARPFEVVMFENNELGVVLSLSRNHVEVLVLSRVSLAVGTRVARTNKALTVNVGPGLLGRVIDPLCHSISGAPIKGLKDERTIDTPPLDMRSRTDINEALETGVSIVDLVIPLGKGQRELVIGDHKTGKTRLLQQTMLTQSQKGTVCIYAAIAKRKIDIRDMLNFFEKYQIKNVVAVVSSAEDPMGIIYFTPYTAMTIAEYFRDQGKDVLVVLDDLTTHAKFYRELSLVAKRFPGRSSYPGDIFYTHSRLLERAGKFEKNSITCLSIAETTMGDLSGYIQTNLMSMTDGHIFFDLNIYNQGRRPAINPYLSVTRVGLQAQTPLIRDISRQLSSFLVKYDRLRQFLHFGAELSEAVRLQIDLGDKIFVFFDQQSQVVIPVNVSIFILGLLWSNHWRNADIPRLKTEIDKLVNLYLSNQAERSRIDGIITNEKDFEGLTKAIKTNDQFIHSLIT